VCEKGGVKNGVVQDKLWLPGLRKFQMLKDQGFFGKILSVRGEFGYWVFEGTGFDLPAQRPSWNYRAEDGGGMIIDMHCHWRYVIDNLFGNVASVSCLGATHVAATPPAGQGLSLSSPGLGARLKQPNSFLASRFIALQRMAIRLSRFLQSD
jgi:predicted dehydrogenase